MIHVMIEHKYLSYNGKFVGKFGTNGSKLGEFNSPLSVAVLSNGRLVVSDYNYNRIQIFE